MGFKARFSQVFCDISVRNLALLLFLQETVQQWFSACFLEVFHTTKRRKSLQVFRQLDIIEAEGIPCPTRLIAGACPRREVHSGGLGMPHEPVTLAYLSRTMLEQSRLAQMAAAKSAERK